MVSMSSVMASPKPVPAWNWWSEVRPRSCSPPGDGRIVLIAIEKSIEIFDSAIELVQFWRRLRKDQFWYLCRSERFRKPELDFRKAARFQSKPQHLRMYWTNMCGIKKKVPNQGEYTFGIDGFQNDRRA